MNGIPVQQHVNSTHIHEKMPQEVNDELQFVYLTVSFSKPTDPEPTEIVTPIVDAVLAVAQYFTCFVVTFGG